MINQRFGRLTVVEIFKRPGEQKKVRCRCDCGREKEIVVYSVLCGDTKSCGCLKSERGRERVAMEKTRSGLSGHYRHRVTVRYPIGTVYNRLTVAGYVDEKNGWAVECRCSCGGTKIVRRPGQMRRGLVKSCGCAWREAGLSKVPHLHKQHMKSVLPEGEGSFNAVYSGYARGARDRALCFELDRAVFREITSKNCHYCGTAPSQVRHRGHYNGNYIFNGIDRVNPSEGTPLKIRYPAVNSATTQNVIRRWSSLWTG